MRINSKSSINKNRCQLFKCNCRHNWVKAFKTMKQASLIYQYVSISLPVCHVWSSVCLSWKLRASGATTETMECPQPSDNNGVMLSSEYTPTKEVIHIQHSAYVPHGRNNWNIEVKCRRKNNSKWYDVGKLCRNAKVLMKHNDVQLQLGSPRSDVVVAAFGCPGNGDGKRMQLAAFGKNVSSGSRVQVNAYLLDDTSPSFQVSPPTPAPIPPIQRDLTKWYSLV